MRLTDSMRRDWDERARKDAFYYIASWRKKWDVGAFLEAGEEDYQRLVVPTLARCQCFPRTQAMVELGCGAGRMTQSFAQRFERVYAFDISMEMLKRAQNIHKGVPNVLWVLGDGRGLSCIASASVDFVFSYLVLQHLPSKRLALQNIEEMLRVLKHDGLFLFQANSCASPTMNWEGRLAWGLLDRLKSLGLNGASQKAASLLGLDPAMAGLTWRGASVEVERVLESIRSAGGLVQEVTGDGTPMTWFCGVKVN